VLFTLFFFGSVVGFSLTTGLFLQIGLGFSALDAALYLAAMAVGAFVGSGVGAWAATAAGRPILHVGLTIMAAGSLVYALSLALLLMLIVFFTNPDAAGGSVGENPASDAATATLLVLFLFAIVFRPDFGVFTTILKGLILIAFLPAVISLLFSIRTGLRPSAP